MTKLKTNLYIYNDFKIFLFFKIFKFFTYANFSKSIKNGTNYLEEKFLK